MDLLGQTALLVGMTSFALGFSVLARNVRNKLFISYAVLATLISLWAIFFAVDKIWPGQGVYRWHLFFHVWLAPAGLFFIGVFARIQDQWARRLLDFTVLTALALSIALGLSFDTFPAVLGAIYYLPGTVVLLILRMMWIDRSIRGKATPKRPKLPTVGFQRRNLIYLGGLVVLATTVMDHVPWLGHVIPSLGNILLTIYLFFLTQAITQQRLLNFEALFSRFLVLLGVALTLTGVYSLLVGWIEHSPALFFLNSFIASFLILMLLEPLRTLVRYFTQRLLTQKYRLIEGTLMDCSRKLVGITDLGTFFQNVIQTSEQLLNPDSCALFLLRPDGTRFRRVRLKSRVQAREHGELKELLADHPLIQSCRDAKSKGSLPILLDQLLENEIDRSASRTQREYFESLIQGLRAMDCNLMIPLFHQDRILGFLGLFVAGPPEPWGSNWSILPMIYPYYEQAAATLQSMEIYARQKEKERLAALGEMAAGLAHEIRNPLGAIKGAAQFLDPSGDRPDSKFLQVIIEEVDRLNRVVTQFLDYSKPAATDMKVIDLSELVQRTVEKAIPSFELSQLNLSFVPCEQPALVHAAPEQIQQVILNLIQNSAKALEHREDGRIAVTVQVDPPHSGGDVTVTVDDNGPGIKKEHLEKLFIPFFTTSPKGTGLGLSISQKIIEAHRGRIEVATEEGCFSRFTVTLPRAERLEMEEAPSGVAELRKSVE